MLRPVDLVEGQEVGREPAALGRGPGGAQGELVVEAVLVGQAPRVDRLQDLEAQVEEAVAENLLLLQVAFLRQALGVAP